MSGTKAIEKCKKRQSTLFTWEAKANKKKKEVDAEAEEKARERRETERQAAIAKAERDRVEAQAAVEALQAVTAPKGPSAVGKPVDGDNDDEEYFSDDDDDYDMDEDDPNAAVTTRASSRYKPGPQSKLGLYLEDMKESILDHSKKNHQFMLEGRVWYPPESYALPASQPDPFIFCSESAWIYHFNPFGPAFGKVVGKTIKQKKCVHCQEEEHLESNGSH